MTYRRVLLILIVVPLAAVGTVSAYWYWAAGQVGAAIADWRAVQQARGYEIAYREPEIGGYPLAITVRLEDPRIAAPGGWRWSAERLAGRASLWNPLRLSLDLPKEQRLSGTLGGLEREATLRAEEATALVVLHPGGWLGEVQAEFQRAVLNDSLLGTFESALLEATLTQRGPAPADADYPAATLRLAARGVTLSETVPQPLGPEVTRLSLEAELHGAIPAGEPRAALAAWRDSGGLVEVPGFALDWGPLAVSGDGTLALDELLRPQGAFTARFEGLPETIDNLTAQGLIERRAALTLKLAAATLAGVQQNGGDPAAASGALRLPVTLQDGRLYLGPVALASLSPVL